MKELAAKEREMAVFTLQQERSVPARVQAATLLITGYAERHPGRAPIEGPEAPALEWFRPRYASFQTPRGLADKANWMRELRMERRGSVLWQIRDKLWNEHYLRSDGNPEQGTTREVYRFQNTKEAAWNLIYLTQVTTSGISVLEAGRLAQLVNGALYEPSALTMPMVSNGLVGLRVSQPATVGYTFEADGRSYSVLQWRLGMLPAVEGAYSGQLELTAVIDLRSAEHPCQVAVSAGRQIMLLVEYKGVQSYQGVKMPTEIHIYRASRLWQVPGTRRSVLFCDSLKIQMSNVAVVPTGSEAQERK